MKMPPAALIAALLLVPSGLSGVGAANRATSELVPVELSTVGFDPRAGTPLVLLRDPESGNVVPIWVGLAEARAIALALHGVDVPRPMTHDLMANLLSEAGVQVDEVVVHTLQEHTYLGAIRVRVRGEDRVRSIDSRPSDALALALRTGAPIRVARAILVEPPPFDFAAPEGPDQIVHALGITVVSATPERRKDLGLPDVPGVVVTHVFGPARSEGLQPGDFITDVNGSPLAEPMDFFQAVRATPAGAVVRITRWRDGESRQLELPVDLPPDRPRPDALDI